MKKSSQDSYDQTIDNLVEIIIQTNGENNRYKKFFPPMCYNPLTKHIYSGINIFSYIQNHELGNCFCTFKQWQELGYSVKKGEHAIRFFRFDQWTYEIKDRTEYQKNYGYFPNETITFPYKAQAKRVKDYAVFGNKQVVDQNNEPFIDDVIEKPVFPYLHKDLTRACDLMQIKINQNDLMEHAGEYRPQSDEINLSSRIIADKESTAFSATLAHEMIHSTGHKNRLNRKSIQDYFSNIKARQEEEIVAELGSYLLSQHLDIGTQFVHHESYINSWKTALSKETIRNAVINALQASNYIIEIISKEKELQA